MSALISFISIFASNSYQGLDLMVRCAGNAVNTRYYEIKIINNAAVPYNIANHKLGVRFMVFENQLCCASISSAIGNISDASGNALGLTSFDMKSSYDFIKDVSITNDPSHKANQSVLVPLDCVSALSEIPPGGSLTGIVINISPGSVCRGRAGYWEDPNDDYCGALTGTAACGGPAAPEFTDDSHFCLYDYNTLLAEMKQGGVIDPYTGNDSGSAPAVQPAAVPAEEPAVAGQTTALMQPATTAPPCGSDTHKKLDLMVNCQQTGAQDRRYYLKILNRNNTSVSFQSLKLSFKTWVYEPHLRCIAVCGQNGEVYDAAGNRTGNMVLQGGAYYSFVSKGYFEENPPHRSNQEGGVPLTWQSGEVNIPAGGWVQGFQVLLTSGGSCPAGAENWQDFTDDYSGLPAGQSACNGNMAGPYYDDHHFAVLSGGVLVAEYKDASTYDSETGLPPGAGPCTSTPTFSGTFTLTLTGTPSFTATNTRTITPTFSNTHTPTNTVTPSGTASLTYSVTATPTATFTATGTVTDTITSTLTPAPADTYTATPTMTETLTRTITVSPTYTRSVTPTMTGTLTSTVTWTTTCTVTASPTPTATGTNTPTVTGTATETVTPTISETVTCTDTLTATPTFTSITRRTDD